MVADRPFHARLSNYGLGVEIQRQDYRTVSHGGFLPGFRTALRYYPATDVLVIVLLDDSTADPTTSPPAAVDCQAGMSALSLVLNGRGAPSHA
jgi:hypothetical protein